MSQQMIGLNDDELISSQSHIRWVASMFCLAAIILVAVVVMNWVLDPYGVFNNGYSSNSETTNERFNKTEHILNNIEKYDTLILGSSRMGHFEPGVLDQITNSTNTYNLSFFSAEASDYLSLLPFLQSKGLRVDRVLIGVDLYPFINSAKKDTPQFWAHPYVAQEHRVINTLKYLLLPSFYHSYCTFQSHLSGESPIQFNFANTGTYKMVEKDYQYDSSTIAVKRKYVLLEQKLRDLKQLSEWFKQNDIEATWFIHPLSEEQQAGISDDVLIDFFTYVKTTLGSVRNYAFHTSVTHSSQFYFDKMHYKPLVANQIMKDLFNGS